MRSTMRSLEKWPLPSTELLVALARSKRTGQQGFYNGIQRYKRRRRLLQLVKESRTPIPQLSQLELHSHRIRVSQVETNVMLKDQVTLNTAQQYSNCNKESIFDQNLTCQCHPSSVYFNRHAFHHSSRRWCIRSHSKAGLHDCGRALRAE